MSDDAIPLEEARRRRRKSRTSRKATQPPEVPIGEAPEYSDEALARLFTYRHKDHWRFVSPFGRWLHFTGTHWEAENTLLATDLAREICREESMRAEGDRLPKVAAAVASRKTVAAVEGLARADREHAATAEQWDSNPWLLNTPAGTLDLRANQLLPHRPLDYLTKITAVSAGGECPTWLKFLERITGGDKQLEMFLQRVAGYCLTGSTQEHALFFLYGTGGNGKSVFINTLVGILGDYATTASMETFTASHNDRHPTELARLRGARLVSAVETEEGRRWAEARIKALTGGDRIAARFMRQDHFEFVPEFKLVVAGNHKPALRGIDEGIKRRMNLVPFTITIPPDERDETLGEQLRKEWPGILAWAIEGCGEWMGEGLAQPAAVRDATDQYLADEDALGQWLAECCDSKPGFYATSGDLFASWRRWADKGGEFVGSQKRLTQQLQDRGYVPKRESHTGNRGFTGIALKIVYAAQDESINGG